MSDLYSADEVLQLALKVVGKKGPVHIDTGIYSHDLYSELSKKQRAKNDKVVLGSEEYEITLGEVAELFKNLHELVSDFEDGRTYFFSGISQDAENKFSINWSS